jgi:hypothetical protein
MAITSPKTRTTMLACHWRYHLVVANQPPTAKTYTPIPVTLTATYDLGHDFENQRS